MAQNPHDRKPDFGEDRSVHQYDRDQIYIDIARAIDNSYEPKGVLESNKKLLGIILKRDTGPNPESPLKTNNEYYHVFVQNVHYNKVIPLALKNGTVLREYIKAVKKERSEYNKKSFVGKKFSQLLVWANLRDKGTSKIASDLKGNVLDRAFEVYVANDFNDGTSYMHNPKSFTLPEGSIVNIKYDSVIGGVPSKGKIDEILFDADGVTPLFVDQDLLRRLALGTLGESDTAFTQNIEDLRLPEVSSTSANEAIEKKAKSAVCKNIVIDKYFGEFNYEGKRFYFDYNCSDFKKVIKDYYNKVRQTAFMAKKAKKDGEISGKGINLLPNGLGAHFKEVLRDNVPRRPYFMGGTGEYTPKWAYTYGKNLSKIPQTQFNLGTTKNPKMKSYKEYYKKFIKPDGTVSQAYDCSGIPSYIAFHSGFILGVKNLQSQTDKFGRTATQQYANIENIQINIEQFAGTPGAVAIENQGSHAFVSAGEGYTVDGDGDYHIKVYEAANYGIITRKRTASFQPLYKKKGRKQILEGWQRFGFSDGSMAFGLPPSFVYADKKGLWTKEASNNLVLAGTKEERDKQREKIQKIEKAQQNARNNRATGRTDASSFRLPEQGGN